MTASAISWSEFSSDAPNPTDAEIRDAAGATPSTPALAPVPRPAASDATIVPCSSPSPPSGLPPVPDPEKSAPAVTAPRNSATEPSTPVSMIAIVTPAPLVTFQAERMP